MTFLLTSWVLKIICLCKYICNNKNNNRWRTTARGGTMLYFVHCCYVKCILKSIQRPSPSPPGELERNSPNYSSRVTAKHHTSMTIVAKKSAKTASGVPHPTLLFALSINSQLTQILQFFFLVLLIYFFLPPPVFFRSLYENFIFNFNRQKNVLFTKQRQYPSICIYPYKEIAVDIFMYVTVSISMRYANRKVEYFWQQKDLSSFSWYINYIWSLFSEGIELFSTVWMKFVKKKKTICEMYEYSHVSFVHVNNSTRIEPISHTFNCFCSQQQQHNTLFSIFVH